MATLKVMVSYYFDIEELDDIENTSDDIVAAELQKVYGCLKKCAKTAQDDYPTMKGFVEEIEMV